MLTRLQILRTIQVAAYAAIFAFSAGAQAAPKKSKTKSSSAGSASNFCASAWKEGDTLAKGGKLRQAMEWMLKCAQPTCKAAVRKQCTASVSQIEADIPTIVPSVTDASGKHLSDVHVVMDGELLASRIDGRGIPVDPGEHEFEFKTDKGSLGTQKAMVPQGQRNVSVNLNLAGAGNGGGGGGGPTASSEAAPAAGGGEEAAVATSSEEPRSREQASSSDGPGFGTYALGVLGLAGVGGYGLLTYWGNKDNQLLDACSPDCKPESLDHIRKLYFAGKVSLGVGIAALAGATILWFTSGSSDKTEVASSRSDFRSNLRFDVAPTAAGGFAAFSGTF
jgi:hypothetical protein